MAIKRFNDYATTKAYTEVKQLPKGAYILEIKGAEVSENTNGQYIKIMCDIAEGEFKNFFMTDWQNQQTEDKKWHCNYLLNVPKDDGTEQDGWTKRRFKTVITAMEDSNSSFHFDWDEKKFKGLKIGGLFNIREYQKNDGSIGSGTNLAQLVSVEAIQKGTYKMPADKLLGGSSSASSTGSSAQTPDFMSIPDGAEAEGLPF